MKYASVRQSQIARIGYKLGVGGQKNREIFRCLGVFFGVPGPIGRGRGLELAGRYLREVIGKQLPKASGKRDRVPRVATDAFLASYEWRQLRMRVLVKRGAVCECCGASAQRDKAKMNVDHIKPRRLFPELALDETNLQILCDVCNHGKGNWDQTDWRDEATKPPPVSKVDPMLPRLAPKIRPMWG